MTGVGACRPAVVRPGGNEPRDGQAACRAVGGVGAGVLHYPSDRHHKVPTVDFPVIRTMGRASKAYINHKNQLVSVHLSATIKSNDNRGIRTLASEEIGTLILRLRPTRPDCLA